jgi:hypothetical protein
MDLFKTENGATFSDCRNYRYALWRIWDYDKPRIMFIGLNPSTADETQNDPTIRRVIGFAKDWGYGGIYMCNLFAIVSTDPAILKMCTDPIGDNDHHLLKYADLSKDILFGWGNFKEAVDRVKYVSGLFPNALCLGKNQNGTPKHPLYIAAKTTPISFNPQQH